MLCDVLDPLMHCVKLASMHLKISRHAFMLLQVVTREESAPQIRHGTTLRLHVAQHRAGACCTALRPFPHAVGIIRLWP